MTSATVEQARDLNRRAMQAMAGRDLAQAKALLQQAVALPGAEPAVRLNLAACHRAAGEIDQALAVLEDILAADPRSFLALLMKASLLERQGHQRQAATAYGVALTQAPPDDKLDAPTLQAVRHAREVNARHVTGLREFIAARTADGRSQSTPVEARRLDAFVEMTLGLRPNYRQQPVEFFYPGLPAIEFYERAMFPWLADLEAATETIRGELETIVAEDAAGFTPYVQYSDNVPLDQWAELNHSQRWSAYHLSAYGQRVEANARRAPKTMQMIEALPQPKIPNRSPAAMFSNLQPKTRIPPHTGIANIRLVAHLPLIVPPGCGFRVGGETREWKVGEAWVFDDTIEHEAWNLSDQPRVILICDVWSPYLSPTEREMIVQVMDAMDIFNETKPAFAL